MSNIAFFLLAVIVCSQATTIPNYIKTCKRNDPNLSACITKAINRLREKLISGIEELGVASLDPIRLDDVIVNRNININITELDVRGAGAYDIQQLKAEIEKMRFAILIRVPELNLVGKHSINMKLLSIPLKGNGLFSARFTEFNVAAKFKSRLITLPDGVHMKFDPFDVKVIITGKKSIKIDGLFKENPTLSQVGASVIEENVDVFLEEMLPEIEKSMSSTVTRLANQITSQFTYDQLFPL